MRISKISVLNIGSYVGEHEIVFHTSNPERRIVLIGGKNGAGKTTLFEALRIGVYGYHIDGYQYMSQKYINMIRKLINDTEKHKVEACARISVQLFMDDGTDDCAYTVTRTWSLHGKAFREDYQVLRDDVILSDDERANFDNYLLQILPPELFQFYFFNGEKINDFQASESQNPDFKRAFLQLCGLDTLEIIRENFLKTYRKNSEKLDGVSDIQSAYWSMRDKQAEVRHSIDVCNQTILSLQNRIDELDLELEALNHDYLHHGGVEQSDWNQMEDQLKKEEAFREEKRRWLKDTANNILPFIILRKQLVELKAQAEEEDRIHKNSIIQGKLHDANLQGIYRIIMPQGTPPSEQQLLELRDRLFSIFCENTNGNSEILMLSPKEHLSLMTSIERTLAFDVSRISTTTDEIRISLERAKALREKMDAKSIEAIDAYRAKQDALLEKRHAISAEMAMEEKHLSDLHEQMVLVDGEYQRLEKAYKMELKDRSIADISAKALLAFEELQERIYRRSITKVENEFKKSFATLINKDCLIDGIHIDDQLNVIPYKDTEFSLGEIQRLIAEHGEDYLTEFIGEWSHDQLSLYFDEQRPRFVLPVKVPQRLSAGEQQIYIMALYQALSQLNRIQVPYIIDTPFARIDKQHRFNILRNFFGKLPGQVIILSTNEEVVGEYLDVIRDSVSDYYLLAHSDGKSSIVKNQYFA